MAKKTKEQKHIENFHKDYIQLSKKYGFDFYSQPHTNSKLLQWIVNIFFKNKLVGVIRIKKREIEKK